MTTKAKRKKPTMTPTMIPVLELGEMPSPPVVLLIKALILGDAADVDMVVLLAGDASEELLDADDEVSWLDAVFDVVDDEVAGDDNDPKKIITSTSVTAVPVK